MIWAVPWELLIWPVSLSVNNGTRLVVSYSNFVKHHPCLLLAYQWTAFNFESASLLLLDSLHMKTCSLSFITLFNSYVLSYLSVTSIRFNFLILALPIRSYCWFSLYTSCNYYCFLFCVSCLFRVFHVEQQLLWLLLFVDYTQHWINLILSYLLWYSTCRLSALCNIMIYWRSSYRGLWYFDDIRINIIQCGAVIFSQIFTSHPCNSSPDRARYGMSFVDPASDWYASSISMIINVISYNIGRVITALDYT